MVADLRWAVQHDAPEPETLAQVAQQAEAALAQRDAAHTIALLPALADQLRLVADWTSRQPSAMERHRGKNLLQSAENAEYLATRLTQPG